MNRLAKLIGELSQDDLKLVQKDLKEGNIEKLINNRLKYFEEGGQAICAVCNAALEPDSAFILFFGTKDFRRKANFCATDCLEYFIQKIKRTNEKKIKGEEENGAIRDYKDF